MAHSEYVKFEKSGTAFRKTSHIHILTKSTLYDKKEWKLIQNSGLTSKFTNCYLWNTEIVFFGRILGLEISFPDIINSKSL